MRRGGDGGNGRRLCPPVSLFSRVFAYAEADSGQKKYSSYLPTYRPGHFRVAHDLLLLSGIHVLVIKKSQSMPFSHLEDKCPP